MTGCVGPVLLAVAGTLVVVTFGIVIASYWFMQHEEKRYAQALTTWCDANGVIEYDATPAIPPSPSLPRTLMSICKAVTANNCSSQTLPPPPGYESATRLVIPNPQYPSEQDMYAYVFATADGGTVLICFTGTKLLGQWLDDVTYQQTMPTFALGTPAEEAAMKIHVGFETIYSALRPALLAVFQKNNKPPRQLIITGHSMGGALSTLCALDMTLLFASGRKPRPTIYHYSFASPRVGNAEFATLFDAHVPQSVRIANLADIVPTLPPAAIPAVTSGGQNIIYSHTGGYQWFQLNLGSLVENHSDAYVEYLARSSFLQ